MPSPRRRRGLTALTTLVALAAVPASAQAAASVSVTGDTGSPVFIPAGAPPTIRNMGPDVDVVFPAGSGRYAESVVGPNGAAAGLPVSCLRTTSSFGTRVNYQGNGTYTVTVANFAADDTKCATPTSVETYQFVIAASTPVTPPTSRFTYRKAGSALTRELLLGVNQNPGAFSTEIVYGRTTRLNPDGSPAGNVQKAFVNSTTGLATFRFSRPGTHTIVARPTRSGPVPAPWSAPVRVKVIAPFDISSFRFSDTRGPSYKVNVRLGFSRTRGRVRVSLARGSRSGKYRSLGRVRISKVGTISKRFRAAPGRYRLRFSYGGSSTVKAGRKTYSFRITRRFFFR